MNQGSNKKTYSAPADPQVISSVGDAADGAFSDYNDGFGGYSSTAG